MTPTLKRRHIFTPAEVAATKYPGLWFGSKFERMVFHIHKLAEAAGEIEDVVSQPASVHFGESRYGYKADIRFRIVGEEEFCWTEAKGIYHPHWGRNLQEWRESGPGRLLIFSGKAERPGLVKTIVPQGGGEYEKEGEVTEQ